MSWGTQHTAQPTNTTTAINATERDSLILAWRRSKEELDAIKAREMELRTQVAAILFPTPSPGTQRFDLGSGYSVKLVHKVNYKLDQGKTEATQDAIEKVGEIGRLLADRVVKTSFELSLSEYKKLDVSDPKQKKIKDLIDTILTTSPGAPTLELEEPGKE